MNTFCIETLVSIDRHGQSCLRDPEKLIFGPVTSGLVPENYLWTRGVSKISPAFSSFGFPFPSFGSSKNFQKLLSDIILLLGNFCSHSVIVQLIINSCNVMLHRRHLSNIVTIHANELPHLFWMFDPEGTRRIYETHSVKNLIHWWYIFRWWNI